MCAVFSAGVKQKMTIKMVMYLLIWGKAANVQFMPECIYNYIRYIFTM